LSVFSFYGFLLILFSFVTTVRISEIICYKEQKVDVLILSRGIYILHLKIYE